MNTKMIPMTFAKILSCGALAFVASQAFAQAGPYADPGATSAGSSYNNRAPMAASAPAQAQQGLSGRPLTWAEFRQSCDDPARFQSQRPPERITISCSN